MYYTTEQVAVILGVVPRTVRGYCVKHHIGGRLDRVIGGKQMGEWVLTEEDIEQLKEVRKKTNTRKHSKE